MTNESGDAGNFVKTIGMPLYQARGWMKFLGVLAVIYGALAALTLVGIVIAWLPIWLGVLLFQSANAVEEAVHTGDHEALTRSLRRLKVYFIIMGAIALIGIVITALGLFVGMMGMMRGFPGRMI